MQFVASSPSPWFSAKPAQPMPTRGADLMAAARGCGWYDSSFDLAQGLEASEQDHDALYQLWELSRN